MESNTCFHENVTFPDFDVEHKKKCAKCVYHTKISGGYALLNVACNYILITGQRRPCPAIGCTAFVKGQPKRTKEGDYFVHNF